MLLLVLGFFHIQALVTLHDWHLLHLYTFLVNRNFIAFRLVSFEIVLELRLALVLHGCFI